MIVNYDIDMTLKKFFTGLHQDERSGPHPIAMALQLSQKIRTRNNSAGMDEDHLLLTPGNSICTTLRGQNYYFHYALAIPTASDEQQLTLLRRCRRALHNMRMIDQQRHSVKHSIEDWTKAGGTGKPEYPTDHSDSFYLADGDEAGMSAMILARGVEFSHAHEQELTTLLKRELEFTDYLRIGEDVMALELVDHVRKTAAGHAAQPDDAEKAALLRLREAAKAMPLDALRLYRELEIPFVTHDPTLTSAGLSYIHNGSISFDANKERPDIFTPSFIAAHELCHALIGHDFTNNRYRHTQDNQYSVPQEIAQAAEEFKTRAEAILTKDPAIVKQWCNEQYHRTQLFDDIRDTLELLTEHHQNDENKTAYEQNGHSWDYELVCNYFALRQSLFAHEPEAMAFVSPKMAKLCEKLEMNTHVQQEQLRKINSYYDNPERDAVFALIQRETPHIKLPTGRSRGG